MDDLKTVGSETHTVDDGSIAGLIRQHVSDAEWDTLLSELDRIATAPTSHLLARVFATIPRKIKAANTTVSLGEISGIGPNGMPLVVKEWSLARLIRVWVLMHIPPTDRAAYHKLIEQLFVYGEVEELVALYSALPVYHGPEAWCQRCTEGIRSNIGSVRQAILVENHYPSAYLDEGSWNQLVLKAFFTDEYIPDIVGLLERNNGALAQTLVDYAYERSAAKREVNPMLWILVAPYIDGRAFDLMSQRIQASDSEVERKAIAYAFSRSDFGAAVDFLKQHVETSELLDIAGTPWADLGVTGKK